MSYKFLSEYIQLTYLLKTVYILLGYVLSAQGASSDDINGFIRDNSVFINTWPTQSQIISEFMKYRGY